MAVWYIIEFVCSCVSGACTSSPNATLYARHVRFLCGVMCVDYSVWGEFDFSALVCAVRLLAD